MLGGFRKSVIGGSALGLVAIGLSLAPTPSNAATGDACAIAANPAQVANIQYGVGGAGHPNQPAKGTWDGPEGTVPRYGLYYPVTDPVLDHVTPRLENHGGAPSSLPATPVQTGDRFMFSQNGECANDTSMSFTTTGMGIGYCGRSVGLGTGTVDGQAVVIRWESFGSQLIMLDPSARGSVNAQPNPPQDAKGSCVDGTAITFLVDGALVDTRPAP